MKNKSWFVGWCFFTAAILLAIFAGFYREINNEERVWFKFNIPQQQAEVETIDLAKQGALKYYLQPGRISLYGRGKINLSAATDLRVQLLGTEGSVSQESKKGNWKEITDEDRLKIRENGILPVNIELNISRGATRRYEVAQATMCILQNERIVYTKRLQIINSNYKDEF